ncbi:MAG: DMT family transporter [bacterium]
MALHRPTGRWQLGLSLSLLTACMWGALPIALDVTLERMDALTITWYRFVVSAVLLGSYLAARGQLPGLRGHPSSVYLLLLVAVLGLGSNYVLYILGLERTSPEAAQVMIQLAPASAMLGFLFFFRERFSRIQWLGLLVMASGMLLFLHDRLGEVFLGLGRYTAGVALLGAAAVTWAAYALAQKQLLHFMSSAAVLVVIYCGSTLLLLPGAAPAQILDLGPLRLWLLAFCALNTIVAYGAFSEALAHWEASRVSAVISMTPLATLLMAGIGSALWPQVVPAEELSPLACAGAVLVVAGSMAAALGKARTEDQEPPMPPGVE